MRDTEISYQVRPAYSEEWETIMQLAWLTFLKFDAADYTQEGIDSFRNFITDTTLHRMFKEGSYQVFVALDGERIIGMISLRNETHISLLFVDKDYHRRGVGRRLIQYLCNYLLTEMNQWKVTVDASPYAVGFYHKLGFCDMGPVAYNQGITYTPMSFIL